MVRFAPILTPPINGVADSGGLRTLAPPSPVLSPGNCSVPRFVLPMATAKLERISRIAVHLSLSNWPHSDSEPSTRDDSELNCPAERSFAWHGIPNTTCLQNSILAIVQPPTVGRSIMIAVRGKEIASSLHAAHRHAKKFQWSPPDRNAALEADLFFRHLFRVLQIASVTCQNTMWIKTASPIWSNDSKRSV